MTLFDQYESSDVYINHDNCLGHYIYCIIYYFNEMK